MQRTLTPAERLVVAFDFKAPRVAQWTEPGIHENESLICTSKKNWIERQVLLLAERLKRTGVCIKMNYALRACGYDLIDKVHDLGLGVFADLKLYDVDDTLGEDGLLLCESNPQLLTVVCTTGNKAMKALKAQLPKTEVLGVTVLTSLETEECREMYSLSDLEDTAVMLASKARNAGMDGIICAGTEAQCIRLVVGPDMTINTPAIRPAWLPVQGENQNLKRVMTPYDAIMAGATRIVVGKPILQAKDPHEAVMRTIDEIASAM